ncbi:hypothetical protein EMIT043CA1_20130 [Pseudomonas brassicacearum]
MQVRKSNNILKAYTFNKLPTRVWYFYHHDYILTRRGFMCALRSFHFRVNASDIPNTLDVEPLILSYRLSVEAIKKPSRRPSKVPHGSI